ncbi:MAG: GNAT family N-acetyltransferase [Beijerinckiaceae bacterium]
MRFARDPMISRSSSSAPAADAGPAASIRVELADTRAMIRSEPEWSDLVTRALEPNVFFDPAFALLLLQHDGFAGQPVFLLAWQEDGSVSRGRLAGLLPVMLPPRSRLFGPGFVRGFQNKQIALGAPLLDEQCGMEAFEAMLTELSSRDSSLNGVILTEIPADGPFFTAWRAYCAETGRSIAILGEHQRAAVFQRPHDRAGNFVSLPKAKRRKELRRKGRRLGDLGKISYRSAATVAEVRVAVEQFLALETNGWKGRRRTSLLSSPSLATFTRTMTRLLAYEGRCRIDSLEVDGKPVAMGILLTAGKRAFFWKTAFDESVAHLSPGVQFVHALTQAQAEGPHDMTDSCAIPDHPMIDHVWPDRLAMGEYIIELCVSSSSPGRFAAAMRAEIARRRVRKMLHTGIHMLPRKAVLEARIAFARLNFLRHRVVLFLKNRIAKAFYGAGKSETG